MFENLKLANQNSTRLLGLLLILVGISAIIGLLVANQAFLAVIVLLVALLGFMLFFEFDIIILISFALIYTNAVVVAVKFHNFPYIVGAFIVPFLLTIALIHNYFFRRQKIIVDQVFWLLLGFLVIQLLGTSFSIDASTALNNLLAYFTEGLFLYFLIINVVRTPRTLRWAIWTLLIAGTFVGGLSLYQQVTGTFNSNYGGFAQAGGAGFGTGVENLQGEIQQSRLEGPLGEKNYYAQIMLALVPLGLLQFQGERSKLLRWMALLATAVILIGGLLTFSRGAAIAFVIMLLAMTFLRFIKVHQLILVLLGIYLLFQIFPQYAVRLSSLQSVTTITQADSGGVSGTDTSTQARIGEMLAAWEVFIDHPLIGVGPGMFNYYYPEYADRVGLRVHTTNRAAHDLYLGIAANHGILGLLLFFSAILAVFRSLRTVWKRYRFSYPDIANIAAGLMLALIAYLAAGLFLSLAYERYLWLLVGLAGATYHIANTLPNEEIERANNKLGEAKA